MSTTSDHAGAIDDLIAAGLHTPAVVRAIVFATAVIRGQERSIADLQAALDGLDRVMEAFHTT